MSFVAWIDFDQADRERTRRIMDLFESEDTRDELGLGGIRDALSDLLFPGTSTIQTRLRYMLFVPWIYLTAGRLSGSAAARQERARALEIALIGALERGGETRGLIGQQARERLKRLPSDVYWAGLLTLGIRRFQGSRTACLEASPSEAVALWAPGLPPAPDAFLEGEEPVASFTLSEDEVGFLRDRLAASARDSLLAHLALAGDTSSCDAIWLHPERAGWKPGHRHVVGQAERFSGVMHGAALLYNLMLCELAAEAQGSESSVWRERRETYRTILADWRADLSLDLCAEWDLPALWSLAAETTHRIPYATVRFVEDWRHTVVRTAGRVEEDTGARALVREREIRLKGVRSRFRNDAALSRWGGASGTAPLSFRWPVARSHLRDLAGAA